MKVLFFSTVIALFFLLNSCEKETPVTGVFKAKLKAEMCGQYIIEIIDSNYFDKGMNWTNTAGRSFEHVFSIQNSCDFAGNGLKPEDVFNCVILNDTQNENNCSMCLAFMETPPKSWSVKVIK